MDGWFRVCAPARRRRAFVLFALISMATSITALAQQAAPALIVADESLPPLNAGVEVRIPLRAMGGVPPYHWSLAAGELPTGISLDPAGFLVGRPTKPGSFGFTVTVTDSGQPAHSMRKELGAKVTAALLLEWLRPPVVHGDRIEGAVQVSNGSKDDFDLTVIIVAVNEIGRATALGYQHFTLKAETLNFEIPFGTTPGVGAYIVHADAVAEIPTKNAILRQRMQTPTALQITQGP